MSAGPNWSRVETLTRIVISDYLSQLDMNNEAKLAALGAAAVIGDLLFDAPSPT